MEKNHMLESLDVSHHLLYSWTYDECFPELRQLYEKAKKEQWNAAQDLDWSISVDPESETFPDTIQPIYGSDLWERMTDQEIRRFRLETRSWTLSQLLHGEQGALMAASQLINTTPWMDAKLYGSTQVMDEGRHVEVFSRYLRDKIGKAYPVNPYLKKLLDITLTDSRWDMKYLGMQVLIEGLALGAFAALAKFSVEPLLQQLLRRVIQDEARHVAFGVISLRGYYAQMPAADHRDREDFAYEACAIMKDRFISLEVAEVMGMPVDHYHELNLQSQTMREYRLFLFTRLVPNLKRLGLLTPRIRPRYEALDLLKFEDLDPDTDSLSAAS
ncbi:MAG: ferritin-like domain-containing protein [Acidobacteria bacterium]|nr:ferritin-like domain-containing protein [Acidobacteriota bacterium]MBI3656200.1 ferritin-like domain-containing protein [Acidobacteriota bacterium]